MDNGLLIFTLFWFELCARLLLLITAFMWFLVVACLVAGLPLFLIFLVVATPGWVSNPALVFAWPFLAPIIGLYLTRTLRSFVDAEKRIIDSVGAEHALWVQNGGTPFGKVIPIFLVADMGWFKKEFEGDFFQVLFQKWKPSDRGFPSYYEMSSVLYSHFILSIHGLMVHSPSVDVLVFLWLMAMFWRGVGKYVWWLVRVTFMYFSFVISIILSSNVAFWGFVSFLGLLISFVKFIVSPLFTDRIKLELTIFVAEVTNIYVEWKFTGRKWYSTEGFTIRPGKSVGIMLSNSLTKLAVTISDLALPSFILGARKSGYSIADIEHTIEVMTELGWPVNYGLSADKKPKWFDGLRPFQEWALTSTEWEQGMRRRQVYLDELLEPLRLKAVEFRRTEEYRTLENEVASLSRYFKSPRYNFPDLPLEDVWFLLGDIFEGSRLTPFSYIIKKWEKKYALGSFMKDGLHAYKKMSRKKFINSIGYRSFKALWRKTFEVASTLAPVAHVSVKDEALPAKKWMEDKLRTVIGSPLGQYIMSTIWNYAPNHNFKFDSTPIKVGMPLNGYWFDRVYSRHSRCQHHYGLDFKEFDSTLTAEVNKLTKAIRKKGFERHKDYDRICALIDVNYDQVEHQLLHTTSTGNIYQKGTGLTTGHSSTSMDNSIGTVVLYLMAWKKVTGLGAREFKHYNELSCFGDDHVLSFLSTRPVAWNISNIRSAMSSFGVSLKLDSEGSLEKIPFLSKWIRKPTAADKADFKAAGLDNWSGYAVFHDRDRLIGKMTSKVKTMAPGYRLKRLISYLGLTAHHPDIYAQLSEIIKRTNTFKPIMQREGIKVPSYNSIMKAWYNDKFDGAYEEMEEADPTLMPDNDLVVYGQVTLWDSFVSGLALLPDLINPTVFNFGYVRSFQARFAGLCSWPLAFIRKQNGLSGVSELTGPVMKSCYSFLDPSIEVPCEDNLSTLMVRHWGFLLWYHLKGGKQRAGFFTSIHLKIANANFMLNGKILSETKRFSLEILDLFVVTLLGFIRVPPLPIEYLEDVEFPDLAFIEENIKHAIYARFWSSLPPNYADVVSTLKRLPPSLGALRLAVSAPTGSGKSTALVKCLAENVGHLYEKLIVIEPRSLIVTSITPYTQTKLGLDSSGATTGMTLDKSAKVWYVTAQELLLHPSWVSPKNLIIMDECHVKEPPYMMVRSIIDQGGTNVLFLSATIPSDVYDTCVTLDLNTAKVWRVNTMHHTFEDLVSARSVLDHYAAEAVSIVMKLPANAKVLIFSQTVAEATSIAERVGRRAFVLSGSSKTGDMSGYNVIVCTSVADTGITIPDVDTIITSDVGFVVEHGVKESSKLYYRLSADDLKQRVGRTGRTNHGQAHVLKYPSARLRDTNQKLDSIPGVMSLLGSGVPVRELVQFCPNSLSTMLGLDNSKEDVELVKSASFEQLHRYSSNIKTLLFERSQALQLMTNDGRPPAAIDNARMGLVLPGTAIDTTGILQSIIQICGLLGMREESAGERLEWVENEIRRLSEPLLGRIKCNAPFPDPDLGEWGIANSPAPSSDDEYLEY
ncbi:RNA dependent RNA polymerase [Rosellinia necatrix fusarivirus 1]|uniref:RNA dependent RNA polymerase n=2 Tax=Riboviria TaxID=2559587 RepID=A0A068Q774_9VIRU|nr:RNA dependent RNA polymerase [Rosellinia necatrix fusarivirus 1]BAP16392.1 RNA dependent RNA polymerase [Rosellinia necatrix fusarivirus 1]